MSKHPYPQHIKDAITEAVFHKSINEGVTIHDIADLALQALWDASRVPDLDSIDELPEGAIVLDKDGFCAIGREHAITEITNHDLPAHVIYWGDTDEPATNY